MGYCISGQCTGCDLQLANRRCSGRCCAPQESLWFSGSRTSKSESNPARVTPSAIHWADNNSHELSRAWSIPADVLPNTYTGTGSAVERQVSTDSALRAIKTATCHASTYAL